MAFEVNAKIIEILPEQKGTSSRGEWVRRGFVAETTGEYPKKLQFDVMGDERWNKMSPYVKVGAEAKISFDIESREWKGRWFTGLSCFSVYTGQQQNSTATAAQPAQAPETTQVNNGNDDVPF